MASWLPIMWTHVDAFPLWVAMRGGMCIPWMAEAQS